ncbi:MAG: Stp1/IreP family PP2C-type Ser/Thr phosphatase [Actinomycetota bacterium]
MNVVVGAKSDVGRLRDGNEDSYMVDDPFFVVADGMGGHLAGDVASSTAIEVIKSKTDPAAQEPSDVANLLRAANSMIWDKAQSDPSLRGMGTTCTLLSFADTRARIAHVGDSRAYLYRDGTLAQLTEDHTLVGRMVKEGRLRPEDAEHHPQRSIITRALGVDSDVLVDTMTLDVRVGDRLLLCSDGLSSMVDASTIAAILGAERDPQIAAERLVDAANEAGGEDNITVIVVDIVDEGAARGVATSDRTDTGPGLRGGSGGVGGLGRRSPGRPEVEDAGGTGELVVEPRDEPPSPSKARRFVKPLIAVAILVLLGLAAAQYALSNAWYVGVSDDGYVTIYKGVPEEIAGLNLSDEEEKTDLALEAIPEFKRADVVDGIEVDSRDEAEATIADLEELAGDPDFGGTATPSPSPTTRRRDR